jgi:hypothetical protein
MLLQTIGKSNYDLTDADAVFDYIKIFDRGLSDQEVKTSLKK